MKSPVVFLLTVGATVAAVCTSTVSGAAAAGPSSPAGEAILERFLHSDYPKLTTYRARRRLEATSRGGKMTASLEAWTHLDEDGQLRFELIQEEGSRLIREHVLCKALETEARQHNEHETDQVELTPANYNFRVGGAEDGMVSIELVPRRSSKMLLKGAVIVTSDGDMVRIVGQLAKPPSWWTRRVDIVRRYARIGGTRVPVEMSSRADVRFVGDSTFAMTYEYTMINGFPVP